MPQLFLRNYPRENEMSTRTIIEDRIKSAVHQSKPDKALVFRDEQGKWMFEIYLPKTWTADASSHT